MRADLTAALPLATVSGLDVATTVLALDLGGHEANLVPALALQAGPLGLALVKTLGFVLVMWIVARMEAKGHGRAAAYGLTAAVCLTLLAVAVNLAGIVAVVA